MWKKSKVHSGSFHKEVQNRMNTVRHILEHKSDEIWSVTEQTSVFDSLCLMADMDIGGVLIMEGETIVGIFSERDYARKVVLQNKTSKNTPVREVMSNSVLYVTPDETIEECMALMTGKHVRHLPVIENKRVIGIISIGDVVKRIISDQQHEIHLLEGYIDGGYVSQGEDM